MLLLEDTGGEPLARLLGSIPWSWKSSSHSPSAPPSRLAKSMSAASFIKTSNPANIFVNCADGRVRLTGFNKYFTSAAASIRLPKRPEIIAGTLPYMAPEQTGRMNRSLDARSDLYAFGVSLYEMLTGALPFSAADPMSWVHCHVARRPVPPSEKSPAVPAQLSAIVMKLLAKTAEERYQTAAGVETDLRRSLGEWKAHGRIELFPLGANDLSDRLMIPEKLYGRKVETDTLIAAFGRVVTRGGTELVFVSGGSGIGKSSVVNELHRELVSPRGLFAAGKFDQYKRNIPYATVAQAFQSLVRHILSKSDEEMTFLARGSAGCTRP